MNEKIILEMVKPYLNNKTLTYDYFENIFKMLSKKEQYGAAEVLAHNNIELVEEYASDEEDDSFEIEDEEKEFEVLYDNDIFTEDFSDDDEEKPIRKKRENLKVRKVQMSNSQLLRLIQEGSEQAKQDLCIKNYGLVKEWVSKYGRLFGNKLDDEDLEQAGMIGMLKAAEKFDFRMDTQFSTYAVWWIRQAITRTIMDEGFTIRVPVHMMEKIGKVAKSDAKYMHVADYYQRVELIAKDTELPIKLVEKCLMLRMCYLNARSLDVPIGEEQDTVLVDLIPDDNYVDPEEMTIHDMLKEELLEVLDTLTDREQKVMRLRFGIDDGRARTLEEVGREFNVTRERIRQIESKALTKLRHPSRSRKLKGYMEGM